jgi:hypothetical protein
MPESVKWRGSLGPTIGAMVRCSGSVVMGPGEVTLGGAQRTFERKDRVRSWRGALRT